MTFCVGKLFRHEPQFVPTLLNQIVFNSHMRMKHIVLEISLQPRLACSNTQRLLLRARFRDTLR